MNKDNIPTEMKNALIHCGYVEVKNKPNLYYKRYDNFPYFIDCRNGKVTTWGIKKEYDYDNWYFKRHLLIDFEYLYKQEFPLYNKIFGVNPYGKIIVNGPSGYYDYEGLHCGGDAFENILNMLSFRLNINFLSLGYCLNCGYDLKSDDKYCSDVCLIEHMRKTGQTFICTVCEKEFSVEKKHEHHISYEKDITIPVCEHCHPKIHNGSDESLKKYKPDMKRPNIKKYKLVQCSGCDKKARVLIDDCIDNPLCHRCKNKKARVLTRQYRPNGLKRHNYTDNTSWNRARERDERARLRLHNLI